MSPYSRYLLVLIWIPFFTNCKTRKEPVSNLPDPREFSVTVSEVNHLSRSWNLDDSTSALQIYGKRADDTVTIFRYGVVISNFTLGNRGIMDPVVIIKDHHGTIRQIDSLRQGYSGYGKSKYFLFSGPPAFHQRTFNEKGNLTMLHVNDERGDEKEHKEWNADGILVTWRNRNFHATYYPDGIVRDMITFDEEYRRKEFHYYPSGIIASSRQDTIAKKWYLTYYREYYESGILKKEGFYNGTDQVLTWKDYNVNGTLKAQKYKGDLPLDAELFAIDERRPIEEFAYIERHAEPNGGLRRFRDDLSAKIYGKMKSFGFMPGVYTFLINVNEAGKLSVSSFSYSGTEISQDKYAATYAVFSNLITSIPDFHPASGYGKKASEKLKFSVTISRNIPDKKKKN